MRSSQPGIWAQRVRLLSPALMALALIPIGQAYAQSGEGVSNNAVTYAKDVAPILQENCQMCHRQGSIAPMALETYEQVRPWARVIKLQVEARNMPPFHYDPGVGIQELKDDRRLSEEQIATISSWVDAGAPLGNPADLPPPVAWPTETHEWRMASTLGGAPDLVVGSDLYTIPSEGGDVWWRPVMETGLTEDRCIRAIEIRPSAKGRAVTHHAIPTIMAPNEDGEMQRGQTLSEYAIGKLGEVLPEDACRKAPANSRISWEIHYSPQGEEVANDQVEVGLWFYPPGHEPQYEQTLRNYPLERQGGGPVLDIAPHSVAMTQGFYSFDHPVRIDSFMPHGHYRLRSKWLEVYYPQTGRRELISMVSNFNVGWQNAYTYQDHVAPLVPTGAVIILTAIHDNTANNPFNPDPEQWVMRGSRTTDEMSHAWMGITHLDEARYQEILQERGQTAPVRSTQAAN